MKKLHLISLKLAALTAAGLLLSSPATRAQPSPVGDWDLVFSGSQKGLAVITFDSGNTLTGFEIVRPAPRKGASTDVDPRHPGVEDPGRTAVTTTPGNGTNSAKVVTNFLGSAPINGTWYHDAAGKIVGLMNQLSETVVPMETYRTNVVGDLETNIIFVVITETNALSFRAVVVENTRITICTYGPNGNNILRGKPVDPNQLDQSGNFYALGKRDGLNFVEFFSLQPDSGTRYNVSGGMGPGYAFTGQALVSRSKQIALYTLSQDGNSLLSVYTGSYNLVSKKSGNLGGLDSSSRKLTYNMSERP